MPCMIVTNSVTYQLFLKIKPKPNIFKVLLFYTKKTNITAGQAEWGGSDKNIQKSTCVTRRQDISQISKLLSLADSGNKNNG